ncbi:alpha/beta hydrolase [Novosphingobium sp. 9]|uniref:alpha/beta hydrolase n=1 Tax=Novosphingobium sp. 9 TaxID=2025349 RepID=UPI0028CBBB76|nr:alpha/beta hydrolase [Novosphingobium sp. 9]
MARCLVRLAGQALSGRLGKDALTGHISDFAIWIDDFAAIWADWAARTPGPHVLIGHSMGGHLSLRAVAEKRVLPDALVLSAPMLGIHPAAVPSSVLLPVAKVIAALGDRRRPGWKHSEKPKFPPVNRAKLLTHDEARYADEAWWREQRPGLAMGAASWGWIERALSSIHGLEKRGVPESVRVPVLLFGTSADGLVSWPAIERAAKRLPNARLLAFGDEARHEILREVDPVRDRAMQAITAFLDEVAPAR